MSDDAGVEAESWLAREIMTRRPLSTCTSSPGVCTQLARSSAPAWRSTLARVYVIFDPAGIWTLGPAVFEREEDAVMQAASYIPSYPGYSLEVRAFDVVPAMEIVRG